MIVAACALCLVCGVRATAGTHWRLLPFEYVTNHFFFSQVKMNSSVCNTKAMNDPPIILYTTYMNMTHSVDVFAFAIDIMARFQMKVQIKSVLCLLRVAMRKDNRKFYSSMSKSINHSPLVRGKYVHWKLLLFKFKIWNLKTKTESNGK